MSCPCYMISTEILNSSHCFPFRIQTGGSSTTLNIIGCLGREGVLEALTSYVNVISAHKSLVLVTWAHLST